MTTEHFTGTPAKLAVRIAQIIANPNTINFVIPCGKGEYIILYT